MTSGMIWRRGKKYSGISDEAGEERSAEKAEIAQRTM
jgi:hypothetical protein